MTDPQNAAPADSLRVRRLRRLDTCVISDALDRLQVTGVTTGVHQVSGHERIAGLAITLKVSTGERPPGPVRHLGTSAIELGSADHVIAIEQITGVDAGCWGGLLTLAAKLRGIAGVVADGPVRDIDEARQYGFPIFTRQLTARTARGRVVEKGTNIAVTLWGIEVVADDFVIADRSAVAFIKRADIDRVLQTAESIAAREGAMAKALMSGLAPSEVMAGNYEHMLRDS